MIFDPGFRGDGGFGTAEVVGVVGGCEAFAEDDVFFLDGEVGVRGHAGHFVEVVVDVGDEEDRSVGEGDADFSDVVEFVAHFPDDDVDTGGVLSDDVDVVVVVTVHGEEGLHVFCEVFVVAAAVVLPGFVDDDSSVLDVFVDVAGFPAVGAAAGFEVEDGVVGVDGVGVGGAAEEVVENGFFGMEVFNGKFGCKIGFAATGRGDDNVNHDFGMG